MLKNQSLMKNIIDTVVTEAPEADIEEAVQTEIAVLSAADLIKMQLVCARIVLTDPA